MYCSILQSQAQIQISGSIHDTLDNTPLQFANIALLHQLDSTFITGTTTDDQGDFQMQAPDSGGYFLRISYLGYGTQFIPFLLDSGIEKYNIGTLLINKKGQNLSEVTIVGEKPIYTYEGEKKIYNVSEDPSVQGGVANDALQNAPGVYVDMEGNITLRGVSGVEIWINDKPSRIKAEGLKSFLQQLPANAIERIEVISNPSAKYSAEGTGGIINIVTREKIKKNQLLSFGVNGSTQISYSPWVSFVIGNEKLSFSTYIGHAQYRHTSMSNSNGALLNAGDTIYNWEDFSENESTYGWNYAHMSLSCDFNKYNNIMIWGGGSFSNNEGFRESTNTKTLSGGEIFNYTYNSSFEGQMNGMNGGLSYQHFFKKEGHKITIDGYIGNHSNNYTSETKKLYNVQTWDNLGYRSDNFDVSTWGTGQLDYTNPLKSGSEIEAGTEWTYSRIYQDAPIDTLNFATNEYIHVPIFSNHLEQNAYNGAFYTTYSDSLWKINYKAGLRYECAFLNMQSIALVDVLKRTYSTFFPTLHLNTRTKNNDNFTLSYSRRVTYPEYELDPFLSRLDEESLFQGNPYLDPAYTDAFEGGYAHFFKSGSSINATLYHRRTNLDITTKTEGIFDTILGRYTFYSTYINAGKRIHTGVDLSASWKINSSLRLMGSMTFYDQDFYADLGSYIVDKHNFTYNSRLIVMWNYKMIRLNINGNYRGATQELQENLKPTYFINATVNADFFNKKMSIRFGMQDIFNWMERIQTVQSPTIISSNYSKSKSQYFTFGLTFRFGKIELEQQQIPPQSPGVQ